ncbi:MAG TPA: polynucleotide adenylyltransferase PcnB, partial [Alphaproteobacteria bacterium]|nr:polynucleotide adenylyltransferase PcnB [Alphaproteobacteria bacterium]
HWLLERRPRLVPKTLAHKRFRAAYDFLMLRISAGEATVEVGTWWTRIQEVDGPTRRKMITELTVPQKRGRPRHRRRKTA